jgi:hypothetical protein
MKKRLIALFAMWAMVLSGCGPSAEHEAIYKDFLAASNQRNEYFRGIKDQKSAGEASGRLREVNERLAGLAAKVKSVPAGSRKQLAEKYKTEMAGSWEEYGEHVSRFLRNGLLGSELAGDPRSVEDFK